MAISAEGVYTGAGPQGRLKEQYMSLESLFGVFQGVQTLLQSSPIMVVARIGLIILGLLLVYLGKRGTLEPLLMIPMGLGMATVNAAVMFFDPLSLHQGLGTLFVEAQAGATADTVKNAADLMTILQIDFLQPIYTFMFSNGLIACFVFMGIGSILDVSFVILLFQFFVLWFLLFGFLSPGGLSKFLWNGFRFADGFFVHHSCI